MEAGAKVRVIFDFIASATDELPLKTGDVVVIERTVDHDWLVGSCNGQSGTFPANFVEPIGADTETSRFAPGQSVVAVETFAGSADGDLPFQKGDVIEITRQIDGNWLEGRQGGSSGIFPVTYITEQSAQHDSTQGDILQAHAVKDNCGQLQDELSFKKSDIITIVEKIDEDWYRGSFNGKTGTLPAVCVEILPSGVAGQPHVGDDKADCDVANGRLLAPKSPEIRGGGGGGSTEPWAQALFPFIAEHPGELSLMDGDRVTLRRRIDDNWLEGEVGGNVGIFPSNYVRVEVEVPDGYVPPSKPDAPGVRKPQTLPVSPSAAGNSLKPGDGKLKGKRAKVLFDFAAVTDQDLGVKQGEVVQVVDKVDADWFEARHPSGRTGFVPVNYLKILEKLKSPSMKRPAPLPPKSAPAATAAQNGSASADVPSGNVVDLLDIFASAPSEGAVTAKPDAKPKPPLPPKTAKVLSADKPKPPSAVDDLLCFDPLGDGPGDESPRILPDLQPLKPQPPTDQVGFKLGGGSYRPVSFAGKQTSLDGPGLSGEPAALGRKQSGELLTAGGPSLLDMSPMDKPETSILAPVSAPLSPPPLQPTASPQKPPLQPKPSFELLTTAKPFTGVAQATIHSVPRPGSQGSVSSPTSPKSKEGLLTLSQVSQDLDRALSEESPSHNSGARANPFSALEPTDAVASEDLPPVPPRQPTPNPFASEEKPAASPREPPPLPPRQPSPNPFRAQSPPPSEPPPEIAASLPPLAPTPAPKPQLPPLLPASSVGPNPPVGYPSSRLIRDDSMASDFSDDFMVQNINFSIRPSSNFQAPTAFKLPPPPTKSKLKAPAVESPKAKKKFNPKSAVPRPRARSSDGESGETPLYSHPQDFELPADQSTQGGKEQFQQDLQNFQASVQQMFEPSQFEANGDDDFGSWPQRQPPAPPDATTIDTSQTASLLDGDFDVFTSDAPPPAPQTSASFAPVEDILGLGLGPAPAPPKPKSGKQPPGRPKEPAPKKKSMPPRPAPPKFAPKSAEDEILAKLRPEGNMDIEVQETIKALQQSIKEMKEAISTQQDQKRVYEQMLQEAAPDELQEMEQQLTDCIGTIENLQTELQSLEDQLHDVRPSPVPESKMTVADFRAKVVTELVKTEQDYVRDIKLCQEGFMMVLKDKQDVISEILIRQQLEEIEKTGEKKSTKGLELEILFGNMEQVIETAEKFLGDLEETTDGKEPVEQYVGQVFMNHSNDLHKVYAEYCRNHDDATTLLEKYEENDEVQEYINQGLELVRQSTNCWDLASFLIKPVQRILKYQLLLSEMDKYSDESFPDKPNLQEAIQTMTEVAKAINEFKRRKDLVMKYRRTGQDAITDKLGRLNLHSIRKKSQRINQRLTQMTGLTTQTVDGDFDQMERRFRNLEKTIRIYVKDINAYLEQLKDATSSEAAVGSDISDYYASQSNLHEVNKYEAVQRHLANKLYKDYTLFVQQRVISPLNGLLIMFQGPHKLIQKRYHKLLDYDSYSNKLEKNKDRDKVKQQKNKEKEKELEESDDEATAVGGHKRLKDKHKKELKDEKDVARKNYEALNVQLKDELPKLCDMGLSLFKSCAVSFVEAERDHINSTLKKLYPLLELSIVKNNSTVDIMKTFEASHLTALEEIHKFSFVPKSLDKKGDRRTTLGASAEPTPPPSAPRPDPGSQSDKQKSSVTSRYPANRVYQVSTDFTAQQPMDMSVRKGELVGIIKEQDPTGSGQRWYADNGASQGFVPSTILQAANGDLTSPEGYGSDDEWSNFTQMQQQAQYFYAEWEFTASAPNELSLAEREVVQLISDKDIEGNSEWWLVDKSGQRGYVPAAYLAKID